MATSYSVYLYLHIDGVAQEYIDIKSYVNGTDTIDSEALADQFFDSEVDSLDFVDAQYESANGAELGNPDGKTFNEIRHTRGALINLYYETPASSSYTLTVYHTNQTGSTTLSTETFTISRGTTVYPSSYAKDISGYEYLSTTPSSSFTMTSNTTITVRYVQVCDLIIHHISNGRSGEEVTQTISKAGSYGSVINASSYVYSNYQFNKQTTTSKEYDDIEYIKVVSAKDGSTLKDSTCVYKDYYPTSYDTYEETTGNYTYTHDSDDPLSSLTRLRLTQHPTNLYIYYDVTRVTTTPVKGRLVVETNSSVITGIRSVANFVGYSLTKGNFSDLGTTSGRIYRPSSGWYSLTPSASSSYSNPTIIYANVSTPTLWKFTDKNGKETVGTVIRFTNKSGVTTVVTSIKCLLEGTLIAMADGTYKCIEDVEAGDIVKSINLKTGEETEAVVLINRLGETENYYYMPVFEDGSALKTSWTHDVYNATKQTWAKSDCEFFLDDEVIKENGEKTKFVGTIDTIGVNSGKRYNFYDLVVSNNCYYADGILCAHNPITQLRWLDPSLNFDADSIPEELIEIVSSYRDEDSREADLVDNQEYMNEYIKLMATQMKKERQLRVIKGELNKTDYISLKVNEGVEITPEMQEMLDMRIAWRKTYNNTERELKELKKQIDELKVQYSKLGKDVLLDSMELRKKFFNESCEKANNALELFKEYYKFLKK